MAITTDHTKLNASCLILFALYVQIFQHADWLKARQLNQKRIESLIYCKTIKIVLETTKIKLHVLYEQAVKRFFSYNLE